MKLKTGYVLREFAGSYVVVATGEASKHFKGMIKLNETGAILWKELEKGVFDVKELANALTSIYDIDIDTATNDVTMFLDVIKEHNIVEE